jgi:hypothetical protein
MTATRKQNQQFCMYFNVKALDGFTGKLYQILKDKSGN